MKNQRIEWVDLAKGLCMVLVIAGHVFWGPGQMVLPQWMWADNCLSTFRMPLYFVISGFFFQRYGSFWTFLRKKGYSILVPFAAFFVLGYFLKVWGGLWFLGCLFLMCVEGYGVLFVTHRWLPTSFQSLMKRYPFLLFVLFILFTALCSVVGRHIHMEILGPYLSGIDWNLFNFGTSVTALPFFLFGYILRTRTSFISLNRASLLVDGVGMLLCLVTTISIDAFYGWHEAIYALNVYHLPIVALYLCGFLGSMSILLLCRMLVKLPLVSYIGRYSLIVLLTHSYLIFVMNGFERHVLDTSLNPIYWILCFVLLLVLEVPIIMFCKRYLPFIFAQKKSL